MGQLGYAGYVVQGGDHGAVLAPHLGRVDPEHVHGVHVNAATIGVIPMGPVDEQTLAQLSPTEQRRMAAIGTDLRSFAMELSGRQTPPSPAPPAAGS